jgi:hypothetical protein
LNMIASVLRICPHRPDKTIVWELYNSVKYQRVLTDVWR